ncbi:hypothetical protein SGLAD_v1c01670 [Spiroplasma gladiatoris]|uniref:Uncharacterized protein n=1 Tax=Spiroplasma gladiatoris TaxID=2143 RepID=A0A4P7AIA4_9MOLU|nr:hypothetical protein [Spiroplasma gladiatoris]QBQ07366.1 hypothetical protein SGLAD_v1c01670 [Spiroplasma gladiatoris]
MLKFVITKENMELIKKDKKFIELRKYGQNFIDIYIQFRSVKEIEVTFLEQNSNNEQKVTITSYEGLELYNEKDRVLKALERRFNNEKDQWYENDIFKNWIEKDNKKLNNYINWLESYFADSQFIIIYYFKKNKQKP